MQEVSRKRPHLGDSEPLPSKKRAVSVNGTTVPINGTVLPTAAADEEPRDQDNLEVDFMPFFLALPVLTRFVSPFQQFRKEAIFRRMRHYSRENERSQARISELEHLKSTYEASLAVMGACWTQVCQAFCSFAGCSHTSSKLIDTIRAHVKPDLSPPSDEDTEGMLCV
jgi:E3 ubiquitin-protein ligase BRE1